VPVNEVEDLPPAEIRQAAEGGEDAPDGLQILRLIDKALLDTSPGTLRPEWMRGL
jgi:hypothetical protein